MQAYSGGLAVEPPSSSGVLGQSVWSERVFSFLSPDKQRAAVSCMAVTAYE